MDGSLSASVTTEIRQLLASCLSTSLSFFTNESRLFPWPCVEFICSFFFFPPHFFCVPWSYYNHGSQFANLWTEHVQVIYASYPLKFKAGAKTVSDESNVLKTKPWIITTGGMGHLQSSPLCSSLLLLLWWCGTYFGWWCLFKSIGSQFRTEPAFRLRRLVDTRNRWWWSHWYKIAA